MLDLPDLPSVGMSPNLLDMLDLPDGLHTLGDLGDLGGTSGEPTGATLVLDAGSVGIPPSALSHMAPPAVANTTPSSLRVRGVTPETARAFVMYLQNLAGPGDTDAAAQRFLEDERTRFTHDAAAWGSHMVGLGLLSKCLRTAPHLYDAAVANVGVSDLVRAVHVMGLRREDAVAAMQKHDMATPPAGHRASSYDVEQGTSGALANAARTGRGKRKHPGSGSGK